MATEIQETAPAANPEEVPADTKKKASKTPVKAAGSSGTPAKKKKHGKKKNQPGKYSTLVTDTIRKLGERNGSSLARIYNEAKKVSWFDQQNGRTYLRYSIKALLLNDSLIQVKGTGANGSFKLNKKKFEKPSVKKSAPKSANTPSAPAKKAKKPAEKKAKAKASPKKKKPEAATGAAKKAAAKPKKAAKKPAKKPSAAKKVKPKKSSKPSVPKVPKAKKVSKEGK